MTVRDNLLVWLVILLFSVAAVGFILLVLQPCCACS